MVVDITEMRRVWSMSNMEQIPKEWEMGRLLPDGKIFIRWSKYGQVRAHGILSIDQSDPLYPAVFERIKERTLGVDHALHDFFDGVDEEATAALEESKRQHPEVYEDLKSRYPELFKE